MKNTKKSSSTDSSNPRALAAKMKLAKERLAIAHADNIAQARTHGFELGLNWAAEIADPADLRMVVTLDLDQSSACGPHCWEAVREVAPSLDEFASEKEELDESFVHDLKHYPLSLLAGLIAGASVVWDSVGDLTEEAT